MNNRKGEGKPNNTPTHLDESILTIQGLELRVFERQSRLIIWKPHSSAWVNPIKEFGMGR